MPTADSYERKLNAKATAQSLDPVVKAKRAATAAKLVESKKNKRFGLEDIAKGLTNTTIQGAANNTDIAGGFAIAESGQDVAKGKGDFLDYFTLGTAALGFVPIAGKAAPVVRDAAKAANVGRNFKKAYIAQNLTDYSKSGVPGYAHPDRMESVRKFGDLNPTGNTPTTARGVANAKLANLPRDRALEEAALKAAKYWESNPIDKLAIYQKLKDDPETIAAGIQDYIPNLYSVVSGRSSAEIADDIAKLESASAAASSYLKSPLTAGSRVRDVLNESVASNAQGFSGLSPVSDVVNAVAAPLPGGARAALLNTMARHRSKNENLTSSLIHPSEVAVDNGRAFGPGTYFAQTPAKSDELFSHFGDNIYKMQDNLRSLIKTVTGKGYIDPSNPKAAGIRDAEWSSDLIQNLIKDGYIGYKHGDAVTNWLVGTKGGPKLVPTSNKIKQINIEKYIEKFLQEKMREARVIPQRPSSATDATDFGMRGVIEG